MIKNLLTVLILILLLPINKSLAELSPQQVVQEMMDKVKSSQSLAPILDYVCWQCAFKEDQGPKQLALKNIYTPLEYKEYMKMFFVDPQRYLKLEQETYIASIPFQYREKATKDAEESSAQLLKEVEKSLDSLRSQISTTTFEIGKVSITEDQAQIELIGKIGQTKQHQDLTLIRIDGNWKLASLKQIYHD